MFHAKIRVQFCLVALSFVAQTLHATLVGYWPLDDNASDAVSTNHGAFVGNEVYTSGKFGKAATFSKDGCIQFGTNVLPQRAYTKSVWFYRSGFATNHILSGSATFHGHALWSPFDNDNHGAVTGHNDDFWMLRAPSSVIFPGEWYHLAVTYDRNADGALKLYMNGTEIAGATSIRPPVDRSLVAAGYGKVGSLLGSVDDIAVWDRALSANEVRQIYQAGTSGTALAGAGIDETPVTVTLSSMPQDLQLYPRGPDSNTVVVTVAGEAVASSGVDRVILRVRRNASPYAFQTQLVHSVSNAAPFSVATTITAELAGYDFEVWAGSGTNEVLVRRAADVVAGDVFAICGQSNAESYKHYDTSHENLSRFIRTYGYGSDQPLEAYSHREWVHTFGDGRVIRDDPGSVGQLGIRLGRQLVRELRVPVAILNGANGGAPIAFFQRNDADPTDLTTNYGRMLSRARLSGLVNHVSAMVWYQGESDNGDAATHTAGLRTLYADWCEDYPALERVYLHQLRAINPLIYNNIGIRDAQRRLADSLEKVTTVATTGLDGHDALHYQYREGYRDMADHLVPMIDEDLYGAPHAANTHSPNVSYAFFSREDRKEVTVVTRSPFDELVCDDGGGDDFWVNSARLRPDHVEGRGNRVVLSFQTACDPTEAVWYLGHEKSGPWVTNAAGVGMLTFYNIPVLLTTNAPVDPTGIHTTTGLQHGNWLMWNESTNTVCYRVFRDSNLTATVYGPTYHDTGAAPSSNYTYGIEAVNPWGTSAVSEVTITTPALPAAPAAPTGLHVASSDAHGLDIWWTPLTNATHYSVSRDGVHLATTRDALFHDTPLEASTAYTYAVTAVNPGGESAPSEELVCTTRTASVYANVPQASNDTIVCALDLPDEGVSAAQLTVLVNHAGGITNYFDRIGYYLELSDGLSTQWVFAAMDAFTPYVEELLPPHAVSNDVVFAQPVTNLLVAASDGANVTSGTFTTSGRVEIWSGGSRPTNVDGAPNASDTAFDWGDVRAAGLAHGSFQVHNCDLDGPGTGTNGETVLAYSGWEGDGVCDVGIGTPVDPESAPDWTGAHNAWEYVRRRLYVLIRPAAAPTPPPPPTNITVESASYYTVNVSWAPSAGATGYTVRVHGVFSATTRFPTLQIGSLIPGTTYTGTVVAANHGGISDATPFTIFTTIPRIFERVPEAGEFVPVYVLDIPDSAEYATDAEIPYALRPESAGISSYDRVAYYLELESDVGTNWAFGAFDAITPDVHDLSLLPPGDPKVVQQYVTNLCVRGSPRHLVQGMFPEFGIIEFWPYATTEHNTYGFTNASPHVYDHGDRPYPFGRAGCLQLHVGDTDGDGPEGTAQTVLAYNGWAGEVADDVGVATASGQSKDWTRAANTAAYTEKRLIALVRPTDYATRDSDGNAVPDWWERRYLHHLGVPLDSDLDGDGFSNMDEYIAGTDPGDALSVPIVSIAHTDHGPGLMFQGLSGRVYSVDYRQNPTGDWELLTSSAIHTNASVRVHDTNAVDRMRFYRLRIRLPR